jgi:putative hydrolase of the HAD superfamily
MAAYLRIADAVRIRLGTRQLIADLRAAGKRVVILTNFQGQVERQHRKIRSLGLHEAVDAIVVTGDIGVHKPDARAFQAALQTVGGAPDRAAMFGDNFVNDIRGALDAGFAQAVWITDRQAALPDPRLVVVRNLAQARVALLGANGDRIADPGA